MKIVDGKLRLAASDVGNFLACRHLTRLDLLCARRELEPPEEFDVGFQALIQRGELHEQSVLAHFRTDGRSVVEIPRGSDAVAADRTLEAMRSGVDVIYQGVLFQAPTDDRSALLGRPDFLVRAGIVASPEGVTRADPPYYEVADAKLARSAKARAVLQTTFYTQLLTAAQGVEPGWMHLALGNGEYASFRVKDFVAYEQQTRRLLEQFIAGDPGDNPPLSPYPDPVEHCATCRWRRMCAARRRSDDDLSLIAGATTRQRRALKAAGIATRRGFASLADVPELTRIGREALEQTHLQARLQVASEDEGAIRYELLPPERDETGALVPNRGLLALPKPALGDLFFDIEGARYYSEDGKEFGLQYLFGVVDTADPDGSDMPRYRQIWCFDRAGENRAFEELIDYITACRERNPRLHVYHYNHYEPTSLDHLTELHETREQALGRLMGRFATREDELDDLFRLGVFVDLYRVVRQGLRAGVESYSIKRLEPVCGYARRIDLAEATKHLMAFEEALDGGMAEKETVSRAAVAGYNEDDCRATLALRDWLEGRRADLEAQVGEALPRPSVEEPRHASENPEVTRIRAALLLSLPPDASTWTSEESAKALLADLIDWHRREAKPAWWRYFHLRTLSAQELIGEPDAIGALIGGEVAGYVKRSVVHRFRFPPQEHGFDVGDTADDPNSDKTWTIHALDDEHQTLELRIGVGNDAPLPVAIIEGGPIGTEKLAERLRDLGDRAATGGVGGRDPATAILLRVRPRGVDLGDGSLRRESETPTRAAIRIALSLRGSYLAIQGPPGTGKTFTGAEQILALVSEGRTVGITALSHAVICNLIDEVFKQAAKRGISPPRVGQRADEDNPFLHRAATGMSYRELDNALRDHGIDVVAGTPWLWAREEFQGAVHTLFVDEASQLSLANVLAVASGGKNLVLLGDPQQLAQPHQAAHPPGAGASALEHILGDRATMPDDAGLLLDETRRMHPHLCAFTSSVFYDGRLGWLPGLERQCVLGDGVFAGSGLRVNEVTHEGNSNDSPEEALEVARIVHDLLGKEWRDSRGEAHPITEAEIMVVTPYNAQIRAINDAFAVAGCQGVQVGTVDKFQGRQAPIVLYSMATSSTDDAPRGMEFLYDLHRLNVATSRAQALAILVASPELVRVFCRTPRQMLLANALCRAWQVSATPANQTPGG